MRKHCLLVLVCLGVLGCRSQPPPVVIPPGTGRCEPPRVTMNAPPACSGVDADPVCFSPRHVTGEPCVCEEVARFRSENLLIDIEAQKALLAGAQQLHRGCHFKARCQVDPRINPAACTFFYVDPVACSQIGYLHGVSTDTVAQTLDPADEWSPVRAGATFEGDGDNTVNVCASSQGVQILTRRRVAPFDLTNVQKPLDLRFDSSCNLMFHTEHQWCRWYGGQVRVGGDAVGHPAANFPDFRPRRGERVSMAGDWIADKDGIVEIHESRIMVTVKADRVLCPPGQPCNVWHLLTSASFVDKADSPQHEFLELEVPVPPSTDASLNKLMCEAGFMAQGGCPLAAADGVLTVKASPDNTACIIRVQRTSTARHLLTTFECGEGARSECGCTTVADCNKPLADVDRCRPSPGNVIAFAGDIRAYWKDPINLWECACACDDPSAAQQVIVAPVQGCAPFGLEEESPRDKATACQSACSGLPRMCGDAPSCRIGTCRPVTGPVPFARFVASAVCEPPGPTNRVASAGDYRVQLDPARSFARVGKFFPVVGFVEAGKPAVEGTLWLNRSADGATLEIANLAARTANFKTIELLGVRALDIRDTRAFVLNRARAVATAPNKYQLAPGSLMLGLQAQVDGVYGSAEFPNEGIVELTFNPVANTFTLTANGKDPDDNGLFVDVVGDVVNHPPRAEPGPDQVVECQAPGATNVVLDGRASLDPDGDAIAHYQWFEGDQGRGNEAVQSVVFARGRHELAVHVYDADLASASAGHRVDVVDTTPPSLELTKTELCVWPPNHDVLLLRLGNELPFVVSDACSMSVEVEIVAVEPDEAVNAAGSGATSPDAVFGPRAACVRSERTGGGDGRTYRVTLQATDEAGNKTTRELLVLVPHDLRNHPDCAKATGTLTMNDARCTK